MTFFFYIIVSSGDNEFSDTSEVIDATALVWSQNRTLIQSLVDNSDEERVFKNHPINFI